MTYDAVMSVFAFLFKIKTLFLMYVCAGTAVICEEERSQIRNKKTALMRLRNTINLESRMRSINKELKVILFDT